MLQTRFPGGRGSRGFHPPGRAEHRGTRDARIIQGNGLTGCRHRLGVDTCPTTVFARSPTTSTAQAPTGTGRSRSCQSTLAHGWAHWADQPKRLDRGPRAARAGLAPDPRRAARIRCDRPRRHEGAMGYSLSHEAHDIGELCRLADRRMYRTKRQHKLHSGQDHRPEKHIPSRKRGCQIFLHFFRYAGLAIWQI